MDMPFQRLWDTVGVQRIVAKEVAGVIEGLGNGVGGLAIGTRVAAPLFAAGSYFGGYAEHVSIDAGLVVPLPNALSFEDATALMIQGLTALYLTKQAPSKGKTVLVSAAAGGVGTLLVQLAKRAGAKTVIAAASTAKSSTLPVRSAPIPASTIPSLTGSSWRAQRAAEAGPTSSTNPSVAP